VASTGRVLRNGEIAVAQVGNRTLIQHRVAVDFIEKHMVVKSKAV